tara:strand:+ start:725 stop:952 length:228 start_codon:yes stop_codon:yes gene_type:complete
MTIQKITDVKNIETTQEQWWMLYNDYTKIVLEPPMQCSGYTTSPHIMVIADTEEELLLFIEDNDLIILNDDAELT